VLPTINNHKCGIKLNFGGLRPVINWCDLNCVGDWGYSIVKPAGEEQGEYEFYFDTQPDYINFILYIK
jgi:hypothetical protein